ncbi:MAG: hypothetical protein QXN01_01600 [Candidatus Anstonellales archaeon]
MQVYRFVKPDRKLQLEQAHKEQKLFEKQLSVKLSHVETAVSSYDDLSIILKKIELILPHVIIPLFSSLEEVGKNPSKRTISDLLAILKSTKEERKVLYGLLNELNTTFSNLRISIKKLNQTDFNWVSNGILEELPSDLEIKIKEIYRLSGFVETIGSLSNTTSKVLSTFDSPLPPNEIKSIRKKLNNDMLNLSKYSSMLSHIINYSLKGLIQETLNGNYQFSRFFISEFEKKYEWLYSDPRIQNLISEYERSNVIIYMDLVSTLLEITKEQFLKENWKKLLSKLATSNIRNPTFQKVKPLVERPLITNQNTPAKNPPETSTELFYRHLIEATPAKNPPETSTELFYRHLIEAGATPQEAHELLKIKTTLRRLNFFSLEEAVKFIRSKLENGLSLNHAALKLSNRDSFRTRTMDFLIPILKAGGISDFASRALADSCIHCAASISPKSITPDKIRQFAIQNSELIVREASEKCPEINLNVEHHHRLFVDSLSHKPSQSSSEKNNQTITYTQKIR